MKRANLADCLFDYILETIRDFEEKRNEYLKEYTQWELLERFGTIRVRGPAESGHTTLAKKLIWALKDSVLILPTGYRGRTNHKYVGVDRSRIFVVSQIKGQSLKEHIVVTDIHRLFLPECEQTIKLCLPKFCVFLG